MRNAICIAVLVLLSTSLFAQNAKVIELSPEDAAQAMYLQVQLENAQKAVDDFRQKVQVKYTHAASEKAKGASSTVDCSEAMGQLGYAHCPPFKLGWEYGFAYSDDYRFIVPNPKPIVLIREPQFLYQNGGGSLCFGKDCRQYCWSPGTLDWKRTPEGVEGCR